MAKVAIDAVDYQSLVAAETRVRKAQEALSAARARAEEVQELRATTLRLLYKCYGIPLDADVEFRTDQGDGDRTVLLAVWGDQEPPAEKGDPEVE